MEYPNKTFILDTVIKTDLMFGETKKHVVIVVAVNAETAIQHLKDKLGFDGVVNDLSWLMDTNHITLYDQTGNKPLEIQAKIIYNTIFLIK